MTDPLLIGIALCVMVTAFFVSWAIFEIVVELRRRRFLKLLDERLRLTAPDFKVPHSKKLARGAQRNHV